MSIDIRYANQTNSREYVFEKVRKHREKNSNYRVIDIGGVVDGWSKDITNLVVDSKVAPHAKQLTFDICRESEWNTLLGIVGREGKFDYAICTHTIEDIYNPVTLLEMLPKIAHAGIVTAPSIYSELSRHMFGRLNPPWLGFIHHRWILEQKDNKVLLIPKLSVLEHMVGDEFILDGNSNTYEIQYHWENDLPYCIFMDNWLGPDTLTVYQNYQNLIDQHRPK